MTTEEKITSSFIEHLKRSFWIEKQEEEEFG